MKTKPNVRFIVWTGNCGQVFKTLAKANAEYKRLKAVGWDTEIQIEGCYADNIYSN